MDLIRLIPENVRNYIGENVIFKTRQNHIVKQILRISDTGKTIYIDHPDLNNCLEIVSRKVYVIIKN